ncbi:MAG TPA: PadR family transcriptional regulator [Bacillota bacterium]|nr:PadR family transcriptional regulator [Bacillota bacterium]HPF42619.1 PadR family transcriptional regulator [Bacillota bacterium]HPJ86244.1 PadR family transcriptional regulator [Bacillota bacterium]HPQ62339.1 PadR family transcriptional regulator [Bacillota bacterium]HRX91949.1 PadR family transcriptional regulator [Candidatus Izemoplasmatales bacterium]
MNAQFKRGIVELCVLSLLAEKDMYGYRIISELAKNIDVNENTIYPILRRLTAEKYFDTYLEESPDGAPRKYYQMTDKGFRYYLKLRNEWDAFIGGVYHIINQGGKKNEEISRRFASRIEK